MIFYTYGIEKNLKKKLGWVWTSDKRMPQQIGPINLEIDEKQKVERH